ncbi:MAG TPA: MBOAT family O-acyltransferase [Fimbriimonadaceae bacterium]|nr:MBOAT family O-acyltransferase [Fimbriimonadaceae bacterium]
MLFNTLEFAAFFAVVFCVYYLPLVTRHQVPLLVAASMVFYAWSAPWLLTLLIIAVLTNAIASFKIGTDPRHEKAWAIGCVSVNLAMLALFKYGGLLTSFATGHLGLNATGPVLLLMTLPLPIGISFYTFEGISLVADTFRAHRSDGEIPNFIAPSFPEHLARTSLFIVFFPHLISGPILKARQFYPQVGIKRFQDIDWNRAISSGIVGFFLKCVVADNLKDQTAFLTHPIYQTMSAADDLALLFGYSMQIFADFAGYSLIAISLAALLGYDLPDNFNFPYISRSLSEFWRRWHISLSTWLRDYLYFPLGGNRKGTVRTYLNLAIVMVLGGLWHGAAWSFAFWGAFHGLGLATERLLGLETGVDPEPPGWSRAVLANLRRVGVFGYVTFGWLFFKLTNITFAFDFVRTVAHGSTHLSKTVAFPIAIYTAPVILYHVARLPASQRWWAGIGSAAPAFSSGARRAALAVLFFFVITNGGSVGQFIYFQF